MLQVESKLVFPPADADDVQRKLYRGPHLDANVTVVEATTDSESSVSHEVVDTGSSASDGETSHDVDALIASRAAITARLEESPYDLVAYLERSAVHSALQYPDLAAGDAYRALLLSDEARTEGLEYHDQALEALDAYDGVPDVLSDVDETSSAANAVDRGTVKAYTLLSCALIDAGCLKSAATFVKRGLDFAPADSNLLSAREALEKATMSRLGRLPADLLAPDCLLPESTVVRREVYPWNEHEPDRFSPESLAELNENLKTMAPKCEVQVATLPILIDGLEDEGNTCSQLGVFATEDIAPGEKVLQEYSLITASNRMKDAVCDACSSELPRDRKGVVNCDECWDTVFCSEFCADAAQERYHPAVCGTGTDEIGKDPDQADADESLHLLLLARVLAIAEHTGVHPLQVPEIKYIWGDFSPVPTLPWSFKYNVELPLHILETMEVDIFSSPEYELWVLNTLYAKFRGTASARKNPLDGKPDVAAVHPYWCLINHDCDPNVSWDWAGRIQLNARPERIAQPAGVRKGEELLNHYCDIRLPVQERREWAKGPLGGLCQCKRCQREAGEISETTEP